MRIFTFDTTLRDGTQGEAVSLSVDDKLLIARKLDELGIDYIEGGWPGSNPKDKEFFTRARSLSLGHARLTAFGATRLARHRVDDDPSVRALVEAGTPVVSIFGKTWDLHIERAMGISLDENLALIGEIEILGVQAHRSFRVERRADRFFHRENLRQQSRLRIQEHHDPSLLHLESRARRRTAEQREQCHQEHSPARTGAPGERHET